MALTRLLNDLGKILITDCILNLSTCQFHRFPEPVTHSSPPTPGICVRYFYNQGCTERPVISTNSPSVKTCANICPKWKYCILRYIPVNCTCFRDQHILVWGVWMNHLPYRICLSVYYTDVMTVQPEILWVNGSNVELHTLVVLLPLFHCGCQHESVRFSKKLKNRHRSIRKIDNYQSEFKY